MKGEHRRSRFFLAKGDAKPAFDSLQTFLRWKKKPAEWVPDPELVLAAKDLAGALRGAGFSVDVDPKGNLTGLRWTGVTVPRDAAHLRSVLSTIAKWVESGSYLSMRLGGRSFRVLFQNGKAFDRSPSGEDLELLELLHEADEAKNERQPDLAVRILRELTAQPIEDEGRTWWERGHERLRQILAEERRWDELAEECARAPAGETSAWTRAIGAAEDDGAHEQAIALGRRGLALRPDDNLARMTLIGVLEETGRHEEVLAELALLPDEEYGYYKAHRRRDTLVALERFDEALEAARAAAAHEKADAGDAAVVSLLEAERGKRSPSAKD